MDLSQGFDIRKAAEEAAWCQLRHPVTGAELGVAEGAPCRIRIKGADSTSYEEAVSRTVALRNKDLPQRPGAFTGEQVMENVRKNHDYQARELASITLDWQNIEWQGEPLEMTFENATQLYTEHHWIRDQLIEFFNDRRNYMGNA